MSKKLFDFVIGNPPYQDNIENNNNSQPMYNIFMDATYDVANKVELITPARFLFNAGQTPKSWNEKMLHDEHFKVLKYESNGKNVFPSADIKGGVAITYHDFLSKYDAIVDFIEYPIVKDICNKVGSRKDFCSLNLIHHNRSSYRLSEIFSENHPEFGKMDDKGKITFDTSITSNIFEKLKNVLSDDEFENSCCIFGREENSRTKKWLEKKYISNHENLDKWKVFLSKSNGTGKFGETFSEPEVSGPNTIATQTFISFGAFESEIEACNLVKYLKTKFLRTLLDACKATPDNARKEVWKYVPLQDFTPDSDIDWSKSIHEIDEQLYKKYDLSEAEINFVETHVKEME